MNGRGRRREAILSRHRRRSVEPAARLQLFYDVLCDLGDELGRYIV